MFIQFQVVTIVSTPSERNKNRGRRLTKKANLTAVFTWLTAHSWSRGLGERVVRIG